MKRQSINIDKQKFISSRGSLCTHVLYIQAPIQIYLQIDPVLGHSLIQFVAPYRYKQMLHETI